MCIGKGPEGYFYHRPTPPYWQAWVRVEGECRGREKRKGTWIYISLMHFSHNKHALLCNKINRKEAAALA